MGLNPIHVREELTRFLKEDLGPYGFTGNPQDSYRLAGHIVAEEDGRMCGGIFLEELFGLLTSGRAGVHIVAKPEGMRFFKGDRFVTITGDSRIITNGIRTALNLLAHLSGITTLTTYLVEKIEVACDIGRAPVLLDTRKTTPGLRAFERYAVKTGGGENHRFGRFDGMIIKKEDMAYCWNSPSKVIRRALEGVSPFQDVAVEVETLEQLKKILDEDCITHIMLDNMAPLDLERAVKLTRATKRQIFLEATGIDVNDIEEIARTGVDGISTSAMIRNSRPIKMHFVRER